MGLLRQYLCIFFCANATRNAETRPMPWRAVAMAIYQENARHIPAPQQSANGYKLHIANHTVSS